MNQSSGKSKTSNNKIIATTEVLEELQKMSHEFHIGVYAETTKTYGEQEQKYIDELLSFGYKIIQSIAIIAGFGFTAVGFAKNMHFFILGEGLLIGSIIYGVHSLKEVYSNILKSLKKSSDSKYSVLKEKSDLFVETIQSAAKNKVVDLNSFESKLTKIDKKLLDEFTQKSEEESDETKFLNLLIAFLVLGTVLILLSFLAPSTAIIVNSIPRLK